MIGMRTKISDLTINQKREIALLAIEYCKKKLGKRPYKVNLKVLTQRRGIEAYGEYNPYTKTIVVYHNNCKTVKDVVRVVLHEYTHYMQKRVTVVYNKLLKEYGYVKHPMEIEARGNEKLYPACWRTVKSKL